MRRVALAALALLAMGALHHGVLHLAQGRMIFVTEPLFPRTEPLPPSVERIEVEHDEGTIFGLYRAGAGVTPAAPAPLVVHGHGNEDTAAAYPWESDPYHVAGLNVLAVEYRGFGGTEGTPGQAAILDDTRRLIEAAAARPEVDPERIVYHGQSLGGGILGTLSGIRPPWRLVLESSFSSIASVARPYLAPRHLVQHPLDVAQALRDDETGFPVLILHSPGDLVVPVGEALINAEAAFERTDAWRCLVLRKGYPHGCRWLHITPELLTRFARGASMRELMAD